MKSIFDILKKQGLEIDDANKKSFEEEFFKNYKTINEYNSIQSKLDEATKAKDSLVETHKEDLKSRDEDLKNLQKQLKDAGADSSKLEELNGKFADLQKQYDEAKDNYAKELAAQSRGFAIKEAANGIKFTSNSAKKLFIQELTNSDLKLDGDKIFGFDDFVNKYKEQDAEAFVKEDDGAGDNSTQTSTPSPKIFGKSNKIGGPEPEPIKEVASVW